jgi:hypothetical protein
MKIKQRTKGFAATLQLHDRSCDATESISLRIYNQSCSLNRSKALLLGLALQRKILGDHPEMLSSLPELFLHRHFS